MRRRGGNIMFARKYFWIKEEKSETLVVFCLFLYLLRCSIAQQKKMRNKNRMKMYLKMCTCARWSRDYEFIYAFCDFVSNNSHLLNWTVLYTYFTVSYCCCCMWCCCRSAYPLSPFIRQTSVAWQCYQKLRIIFSSVTLRTKSKDNLIHTELTGNNNSYSSS